MKKYKWNIAFRLLLLLFSMAVTVWLFVHARQYFYGSVMGVIALIQAILLYQLHIKILEELQSFAEAVRYRDFSVRYDETHAAANLQALRISFNTISDTFRNITNEKEAQHHYLQKVLELVNTGILSYETESGEVAWMNESLKLLLQIPYFKNIRSIEKREPVLFDAIQKIASGETAVSALESLQRTTKVLLAATTFHTGDKEYKLVAFQNASEALDETESQAWQKLLSVMTHEIMNSVAPISSLATTLHTRLSANFGERASISPEAEDVLTGIETIRKRSDSLLRFSETYRNLNKISTPNRSEIYVSRLFENITRLMEPTLEQKQIEFAVILKDTSLKLDVDAALIEQVLINLVLNAIDAVKDVAEPVITLSARTNNKEKVEILLADNGIGMSKELLDRIFIPFFTTKKSGNGIGLSLCKQIMMLHKGNIYADSVEGKGTLFTLQF
ncbi:MAG: HAMP domain-containing histidine kinase [Chitinophagaceae bacterium]|nr:HAMP domain-containing histidine kinase [Chitinophagaceae bacterium]